MSLIYLAGPIDYGTNDSDERQAFIDSVSRRAIVYDATTTFRAPKVDDMEVWDMKRAIAVHHAAIESCTAFVADMRKRSVGIPIEMWIAHELNKPIYVMYDRNLPHSIYIESVANDVLFSWYDIEKALEPDFEYV